MWYVYVLVNKARSYRYIGITQNIETRLRDHNYGKTKSTKPYRPFNKIITLEESETRKEARLREKYFKSGVGRERVDEIIGV